MNRRPHRSFRRTRRRDYVRSLRLPGYIGFTLYVNRTLAANKLTFLAVVGGYIFILLLLGGVINQDTYQQMANLMTETREGLASMGINRLGEAALLFLFVLVGGSGESGADQQLVFYSILLLVWLCTVWLLREIMAGHRPKFRDGLYSSGAPIVSTLVLVGVGLAQLLPLVLLSIVYSALSDSGLLVGGFAGMLFGLLAASVVALILYWWTSTAIALVVVTLPGMYPLKALSAAGDLVIGRRLRIMLRLLWAVVMAALVGFVCMVGAVLLQSVLAERWVEFAQIPVAATVAVGVAASMVVWLATYVYLLYRKIVDDDARPA